MFQSEAVPSSSTAEFVNPYIITMENFLRRENWLSIYEYAKIHNNPHKLKYQHIDVTYKEFKFYMKFMDVVINYQRTRAKIPNEEKMFLAFAEVLKLVRFHLSDINFAKLMVVKTNIYELLEALLKYGTDQKNGNQLYTKFLLNIVLDLINMTEGPGSETVLAIFESTITKAFRDNFGHIHEVTEIFYKCTLEKELWEPDTLQMIVHHQTNTPNQFTDILMERIVFQNCLWYTYKTFPIDIKLGILLYTKNSLLHPTRKARINDVPSLCIDTLLNVFDNPTYGIIISIIEEGVPKMLQELLYVIQIIDIMTTDEKQTQFKDNTTVLRRAVTLLENLNKSGGTSYNFFRSLFRLSENVMSEEYETAYFAINFKAELATIIGHLCFNNKPMQKLAKNIGAITTLLDCILIDFQNSDILQWAVYAMKSVCWLNDENKYYVMASNRFPYISKELLQEFGISPEFKNLFPYNIHMQLNKDRNS